MSGVCGFASSFMGFLRGVLGKFRCFKLKRKTEFIKSPSLGRDFAEFLKVLIKNLCFVANSIGPIQSVICKLSLRLLDFERN